MSDNGTVHVDTDAMQPGHAALRAASDRALAVYNSAYAANEKYWGCWGNDSTGQQFGQAFGPAAENVLSAIMDIAKVASSTSDGIGKMIHGYTATENDNVEALTHDGFSSSADNPAHD